MLPGERRAAEFMFVVEMVICSAAPVGLELVEDNKPENDELSKVQLFQFE